MRELLTLRLVDIEASDRARQDNQLDDDFLVSIREKGVLQPVTVKRTETGTYRLLAGGRRFAGAREVGLTTIPCHVLTESDALDSKEIEYIENALRKDLKWQERMQLVAEIHQLMTAKYGERGSQSATAKFIDRSVGGVSRILSLYGMCKKFPVLLKLPTEDDAVKQVRKLMEGALVKKMAKDHNAAAADAGVVKQNLADLLPEEGEEVEELLEAAESGRKPGEGFREDEYIRKARAATNHYRIGDAFDGLKEMIEGDLHPPIQLCEVDPPYGIDLQDQKKGDGNHDLDLYKEVPRDKYEAWTYELIGLLDQVLPKNCRIVYWYAQEWYHTITSAFETVGWSYDPIPCIWNKGSGQTNAPDLYLARTYETFLVAAKGEGVPIAERGRSNVFSFSPVPASRKYHPTQKPLELMDAVLGTFGWPGTILLCPFLGSGVTLRSAYRRGMLPFGWELNEHNKEKFLAAVEEDVQNYKVGEAPQELKNKDIPF